MKIDNAIIKKRKLCEEWNQELSLTPENDITHIKNCKDIISLYEKEIEWLQELKIFRELYPNTDTKSSLKNNYLLGIKDFVNYLNDNAFELRHDMELIQKYAEKFINDEYIK